MQVNDEREGVVQEDALSTEEVMSQDGLLPSDEAEVSGAGEAQDEAPREDFLDDLRRERAAFENFRKQSARRQTEAVERAKAGLIEKLLPVLDSFERAVEHGEGGAGVQMVLRQLTDALGQEGLEEVPSEGARFDPHVHEAVDSVEDPSVEGQVVKAVYRRGYALKGKLLQPALVVVARPPEGGPASAPEGAGVEPRPDAGDEAHDELATEPSGPAGG